MFFGRFAGVGSRTGFKSHDDKAQRDREKNREYFKSYIVDENGVKERSEFAAFFFIVFGHDYFLLFLPPTDRVARSPQACSSTSVSISLS